MLMKSAHGSKLYININLSIDKVLRARKNTGLYRLTGFQHEFYRRTGVYRCMGFLHGFLSAHGFVARASIGAWVVYIGFGSTRVLQTLTQFPNNSQKIGISRILHSEHYYVPR